MQSVGMYMKTPLSILLHYVVHYLISERGCDPMSRGWSPSPSCMSDWQCSCWRMWWLTSCVEMKVMPLHFMLLQIYCGQLVVVKVLVEDRLCLFHAHLLPFPVLIHLTCKTESIISDWQCSEILVGRCDGWLLVSRWRWCHSTSCCCILWIASSSEGIY